MKNKIFLQGLSVAFWVIASGSFLFWIYPLIFPVSLYLGWSISRQTTSTQMCEVHAYIFSLLPSAVAALCCLCYWYINPEHTFGTVPGIFSITSFILVFCAFMVGRYLFPKA